MQVSGHIQNAVAPAISAAVVDATLKTIPNKTAEPSAEPVTTYVEPAPTSASSEPPAPTNEQTGVPIKGVPGVVKIKFIRRGNNPRKYFDDSEMQALINSVREHGINQPILVRPVEDDMYEIIAGERRYRAALTAHGDEYEMPVLIRQCTDAEAQILANVENTLRADMSATEEAESAAVTLGYVKGDRDEAARLLSWSRSKLDSRLALMNCSESVRTALNERKIKLGHAELFAALSKENQDKIMPAVIERSLTVLELKGLIEKAAAKLSAAVFDKTECAACPHNSSVQKTMFDNSVTDGSCTNSSCYKAKTEATLEATKESLKDEYPVIRIVRAGENFAQVKLRPDGPTGVGAEQAEACRACSEFGAAISALPEHVNKVYKDMCFNTSCNQEKVAARIRAEKEAKEALAAATASANSGAEVGKGGKKGASDTKSKEKPTEVKTTVSENERIKAYREKVWRVAMKKEVASSYERSTQYLLALAVTGNARHINQTQMTKVFETLTGENKGSDILKVAEQAGKLAGDQLDQAINLLAVSAMDELPVGDLTRLAKHTGLDLTKHWKLDAEFLNLLTKSEIQVVAKAIKLDKAIGDGFSKLTTEKKDVFIEKLLAIKAFDYSATIPPVLMYK